MVLRAAVVALLIVAGCGASVASTGTAKRPAKPRLQEPFDVVQLSVGRTLVADRRASAVFTLDLRRRTGRRLVRLFEPRAFARFPDGRVAVATGHNVVALDPRTGRTERLLRGAKVVLGLAVTADGTLYASEGTTVVRRGPAGGREVVAEGFEGVHGLLATADGVLAADAFAGDVVLVDTAGRKRVVASGLGNPSYLARGADGAIYLTEFASARVSRLAASGAVTRVADVASPAGIAASLDGALLVATLSGRIVRVRPATGGVRTVYP